MKRFSILTVVGIAVFSGALFAVPRTSQADIVLGFDGGHPTVGWRHFGFYYGDYRGGHRGSFYGDGRYGHFNGGHGYSAYQIPYGHGRGWGFRKHYGGRYDDRRHNNRGFFRGHRE